MKGGLARQWIVEGVGLALILVGFVGFAAYRNTVAMTESAERVQRTYQMLNRLTELYAEMAIAESSRRGYISLKDNQELERYYESVERINHQLQQIKQDVDATLIQQLRVQELETLIQQRLDLLDKSILLYQSGFADIETQLAITEKSIQLRERIQLSLAEIRYREEQFLESSIQQANADIRRKIAIELFTILFSFTLVASICMILYWQQTQHQKYEALEWMLSQEKELSELKLRFFSMVSHEFRTPLSVILASSQLLQEILEEIVDETKLKNLHRIQSSAKLMHQLLMDILTLSRAEAGRLECNPVLVDVESFCLNLLEDIQSGCASSHAIKFVSQGYCARIWFDEKLMYCALSNLLFNAIKYSPAATDIIFTLIGEAHETIFQITDQGIGIAIEDQAHIFTPFYRGQNVADIVGSGLGLAVVQKCLELHNGSISVQSEVGKGTKFTVRIPTV
jgi:signal transduction histidine kinase